MHQYYLVFSFSCINSKTSSDTSFGGRHRKLPDSARCVRLHIRTLPGIVHGRFELRIGSADEMGNHRVYTPGLAPCPGCCRVAGPFFPDWGAMPAAPGCRDVLSF